MGFLKGKNSDFCSQIGKNLFKQADWSSSENSDWID